MRHETFNTKGAEMVSGEERKHEEKHKERFLTDQLIINILES